MTVQFYKIDAFTNEAFKGNPAAVCLLTEEQDAEWMQKVASEMNLSETAFLLPKENGYSLRWFTPVAEVDLCGHATLASAHALFEHGTLGDQISVQFFTKSGILTATKQGDWIELNFPSEPPEECECPEYLLNGLGHSVTYCGKNRMDYIVEVESEELVRNLEPNWSELEKVDTRGIVVTARSTGSEFDFVSRAFFPALGISEDPVTGSAHCGLAPYWEKQLNKQDFLAFQASARGGILKVSIKKDRILIGGQAVTVMRGEILA